MLKFPSTPHLSVLGTVSIRDDKVFSDQQRIALLEKHVTIEEKIDGANLGISFDSKGGLHLQNRGNPVCSPYFGQWKRLPDWLQNKTDNLFDALGLRYQVFGEWCFAKHSIFYNALPDWFIAFDVYDIKAARFLAIPQRNQVLEKAGLCIIKEIGSGVFSMSKLTALMGKSAYGEELCEGIYLRQDEGGWLKTRAKLVRAEFVQSIDTHWSKKPLQANRIAGL